MNRRGFLSSILASGTAPYVSRLSGVLMPVKAITVPAYPFTEYGLSFKGVPITFDDYKPGLASGRFTEAEIAFVAASVFSPSSGLSVMRAFMDDLL